MHWVYSIGNAIRCDWLKEAVFVCWPYWLVSDVCRQSVKHKRVRVKDRTNKKRQDIKRRESQRQINNYITRSLYIQRNKSVWLARACQINSSNTLQAKPRNHPLYSTFFVIYFRSFQWYYKPVHCTLVFVHFKHWISVESDSIINAIVLLMLI